MTIYCIICKAEPNPQDHTRNFHRFPKNEDIRGQWMKIIGINCVKTTWAVCSEHFESNSYHATDGYTSRKRLLSNAVPVLRKSSISADNQTLIIDDSSHSIDSSDNGIILSTNFNEEFVGEVNETSSESPIVSSIYVQNNSIHTEAELIQHGELQNTSKVTLCTNSTKTDEKQCLKSITKKAAKSIKRQLSNGEETDISCKRVRFMDGFQTQYFSREDVISDEAWSRFLKYSEHKNNQIKAARQKGYRERKKISNYQNMLKVIENEKISAVVEYLQGLPEHVKQLINCMKNKSTTETFPPELKTFARTLHFYSPAAYEMVRKSFLKSLPCSETLNRWNSSKNYKPGICEEVIAHVSQLVKVSEKKNQKLIFNITFDEMYIKKHMYYCNKSHEWKGLADLGGQIDQIDSEGQSEIASKALVFVLVCINGCFKTPIAYYLCAKMTGAHKSLLLKDSLIKLNENDITVLSVTFDGDESNQRSCKLLGANFKFTDYENFRPYFLHPVSLNKVYIFFDACHMLKLVRNYFAKESLIFDSNDKINWEYIIRLNNKQYAEGMHCACKVRNRHVHFQNEKMKVFLAAQVLSSSTAAALHFLQFDLLDSNFKDASATSKFCQIFNDIFDVLNVKNKFCKVPGRTAITEENLLNFKNKIDNFIDYICKLSVDVPIKKQQPLENKKINETNISQQSMRKSVLLHSATKTGFVGFIICLTNLYSICRDIFEKKVCTYVLSYKFSQDHVETFFSAIRRMNGFTMNPTTIQFQSAFKKLLSNNMNIMISKNANCITDDETLMMESDIDYSGKILQKVEANKPDENLITTNQHKNNIENEFTTIKKSKITPLHINKFLHSNCNFMEHDYSKNDAWIETEYLDHIIKHTAGAVVHSISKKIHCDSCLQILNGSASDKSKLTLLKNRGGLKYASDDVNLICRLSEKIIRQNRNVLLSKEIYYKIVLEILKIIPSHILDDKKHNFDQELLFDHRQKLIYIIVQNYVDKRLKHEADKLVDVKYRVRMLYNKLTIFKGE